MTATPKVSVIIPVFNAEDFVAGSIQSICNQSYRNLEILICDDGSTDSSVEKVGSLRDSRIRFVRNEQNIGYLRTINKLLSLTTGEYIAFHDADDLSHPRRIELQVNYLQRHPGIALVGTNFSVIDQKGALVHQHFKQLTDPKEIGEQLLERNVFQKPSILFARKVYEVAGGFREGFLRLKNISEDYDWLLRVSESFALSNMNGDEPLYQYRSVPSAMSKGYVNIEQAFGHKISQHLFLERKAGRQDSLDRQDWDFLERFIQELRVPYQQDPSLFYYEKAESLLYSGLYTEAVRNAARAFALSPWKKRNVKCFGHAVKVLLKNRIKMNT